MRAAKKPATIDHYLDGVPDDRRAALEKLRAQIHAALPDAEECIKYSMPAFRRDGKVVAGFLATKAGASYYPFSSRTLKTLAKEVAKYSQTAGALHFDVAKGLPSTLVKKLVKTRLAEAK